MKHLSKVLLVALCGIAVMLSSCKKEQIAVDENPYGEGMGELVVHTNFEITEGEMDKSASDMTRISVRVYDATSGTLVDQLDQISSNPSTFGESNTWAQYKKRLHAGSYRLVVVAYKTESVATFSWNTGNVTVSFADDAVKENFSAYKDVTIESSEQSSLSVNLTRKVAKFVFQPTVAVPSNVDNLEIVFSKGGSVLNIITGFSTTDLGRSVSGNASSYVGTTNAISAYLFVASAEEQMNVTLNAKNVQGTIIYTKTLENVVMKQNKMITATGDLFSSEDEGTFTFDDDWEEGSITF